MFPQLDGLGRSSTARKFALRDLERACAYLRDPILGIRYAEISRVVAEQLEAGVTVEHLVGGATDAHKLVSSVTLFHAAASHLAQQDSDFTGLAQVCDGILRQTTAQGYGPCQFTIERCTSPSPHS